MFELIAIAPYWLQLRPHIFSCTMLQHVLRLALLLRILQALLVSTATVSLLLRIKSHTTAYCLLWLGLARAHPAVDTILCHGVVRFTAKRAAFTKAREMKRPAACHGTLAGCGNRVFTPASNSPKKSGVLFPTECPRDGDWKCGCGTVNRKESTACVNQLPESIEYPDQAVQACRGHPVDRGNREFTPASKNPRQSGMLFLTECLREGDWKCGCGTLNRKESTACVNRPSEDPDYLRRSEVATTVSSSSTETDANVLLLCGNLRKKLEACSHT